MTHRNVLSLIAFAAAALAVGSPAEAGGGVRLNFGGPLPSFVATPTPGYGGRSHATPRKAAPKVHAAKRRSTAPVVAARHKPKAPHHIVAVRHTPTSNAPKAIPTVPVTANEGETPGFIGRALAIDNLPRAETVHALLPSETIVAKDAPELAEVATAYKTNTEAAAQKPATNAPAVTCRKFIPAVGVTVTVACD